MAGIDRNDQNLPDRVRVLERKLDAFMKGAPLRNASITEGGIRVGGDGYIRSMNWDGTSLADPGTEGWALGGPEGMAILNTLLLRKGIIGNDALTSPILVDQVQNAAWGWGMPGTEQTVVSETVVTPEGFTKATLIVFVTLSILGYAGSGNSYVRCRAAATRPGRKDHQGQLSTAFLYDTDAITMSAAASMTFTGLTDGSEIVMRGTAEAPSGAKPSVASNTAVVNGLLLFTR